MVEKKLLLIIDPQIDFISGSLAVEGATDSMVELSKYVATHANDYLMIAITQDWHPTDHCSFKEQGGIWPSHCVAKTEGSEIFQPILDAITLPTTFLHKGDVKDKEEYSVMDNEKSSKILIDIINILHPKEIDVCGIALDYCVLESVKGLMKNGVANINLLSNFTPSIGNKEETLKEFEKLGIKII